MRLYSKIEKIAISEQLSEFRDTAKNLAGKKEKTPKQSHC